ncbi:MAG: T9SS type A sorting domain-containing protein, partial [Phaeodactylibacter sp.]|nr:T9SS type A sorting domain-containing protein [Phaeodactylibacter sp.]
YTGALTAMVGDTASLASLSDDCFDLSDNYVAIVKEQAPGSNPSTFSIPENTPEELGVKLWPVPAAQTLAVSIYQPKMGRSESGRLEVMDQAGRIILSRSLEVETGSQQLELDVAALQPGFYMLRCYTGSSIKTVRFLKQ